MEQVVCLNVCVFVHLLVCAGGILSLLADLTNSFHNAFTLVYIAVGRLSSFAQSTQSQILMLHRDAEAEGNLGGRQEKEQEITTTNRLLATLSQKEKRAWGSESWESDGSITRAATSISLVKQHRLDYTCTLGAITCHFHAVCISPRRAESVPGALKEDKNFPSP